MDRQQVFKEIFSASSRLISDDIRQSLVARAGSLREAADILCHRGAEFGLPGYVGELARLELAVSQLKKEGKKLPQYTEKLSANPSLHLFENTWKNLASLLNGKSGEEAPEKGHERVMVWQHPSSGMIKIEAAGQETLLALKMALEGLTVGQAAQQGDVPAAFIEAALIRALDAGVVTGPEPGIKRDFKPRDYPEVDPSFSVARIFSLQWHITQACDLHCRHCYDRSHFKSLSLPQEIKVLDDLAEFCSYRHVHGQVTFTGGNPLLHENFATLYREAAERGFSTAVLGNPATREQLHLLTAIQPPVYYQVSLEGLPDHNDYMRGRGHFDRVLDFLDLLREVGIYSMVMLTLTSENLDQVLPLAEILRTRADLFTFNRLSLVGEGANLAEAAVERYPAFLKEFNAAVDTNQCLGMKDNLFNILRYREKQPLFGGCTGFGCGAAFNFITLLADGTVHACRKFPSPLGNIMENSLDQIYRSGAARRYRLGPAACSSCAIRPVCGGCLAVSHSHGLDIFTEKDPYCFRDLPDSFC